MELFIINMLPSAVARSVIGPMLFRLERKRGIILTKADLHIRRVLCRCQACLDTEEPPSARSYASRSRSVALPGSGKVIFLASDARE